MDENDIRQRAAEYAQQSVLFPEVQQVKGEISRQTNISIRTLDRYISAYQNNGVEGSKPKVPETGNNRLPKNFDQVLEQAILLRREILSRSIDLKCALPLLDRSQVAAYISTHLSIAGYSAQLFTDQAVDLIFKSSAGSLRTINKICTHCLLFAVQRGSKIVDDHMVSQVIDGEML